jgi:integrase
MAGRKRGPKERVWHRQATDSWYIKVDGRQIRIVDENGEPVRGVDEGVKAAGCWAKMLNAAQAHERGEKNEVQLVFFRFLETAEGRYSFVNYQRILRSFLASLPTEDLPVAMLTARHVHLWWAAHPDWSDTTRAHYLDVVSAALNWAARPENKLIPANPLRGMKRPRQRSRGGETIIPDDVYAAAVARAEEPLRDVLVTLRETGTRPSNVARVEKADVDFRRRVWVLRRHKTAEKTGRPLLVPMTPAVEEICRRLAERHPTGPLYRSPTGKPWDAVRMAKAFERLRHQLTRLGVDVPRQFFAYSMRHTRLTELLAAGVSESQVAAIAGHKGTAMLHLHYSHLLEGASGLVKTLEQVPGPTAGRSDTPTAPAAPSSAPAPDAPPASGAGEGPAG